MYDLIIIGGGPAGITAAIYSLQNRLDFLLVSKNLGGKANMRLHLPGIEHYILTRGVDVVGKMKVELEHQNAPHFLRKVTRVDREGEGFVVHTEGDRQLEARSVILATGARSRRLNIEGERNFASYGLSYSASSYQALCTGKNVVVTGDDRRALRAVLELANVASQVHMVGGREQDLDTALGRRLEGLDNVHLWRGYRVIQIRGETYCEQVVVMGPAEEKKVIDCDAVFIENALVPNSGMVSHLVSLDGRGQVKVDHLARTDVPGLFSAGDVTTASEQVLVAIGEGAKAALSAYDYLLA